mgnify:CR=1 FL=1
MSFIVTDIRSQKRRSPRRGMRPASVIRSRSWRSRRSSRRGARTRTLPSRGRLEVVDRRRSVVVVKQLVVAVVKLPPVDLSVTKLPRVMSYPVAALTLVHDSVAAPPEIRDSTTPGVPVGAATLLSTVPSQLSSIPLHVSVLGAPGTQLSLTDAVLTLSHAEARAGSHAAGRLVGQVALVVDAVAVLIDAVAAVVRPVRMDRGVRDVAVGAVLDIPGWRRRVVADAHRGVAVAVAVGILVPGLVDRGVRVVAVRVVGDVPGRRRRVAAHAVRRGGVAEPVADRRRGSTRDSSRRSRVATLDPPSSQPTFVASVPVFDRPRALPSVLPLL